MAVVMPAATRNAPGHVKRSISQPNSTYVVAMPAQQAAVTSPLAVSVNDGGDQLCTSRAAVGCSGAVMAPNAPRSTSSAANSTSAPATVNPSAPTAPINTALPVPK